MRRREDVDNSVEVEVVGEGGEKLKSDILDVDVGGLFTM